MATVIQQSEMETQLRKAVAEFFEVDANEIGPTFSLVGPRGQSSITRAALDSLIRRRLGVTLPSIYLARTYSELEAELVGGTTATQETVHEVPGAKGLRSPLVNGTVHCGIDIELIDNLPSVADYWESAFYQDHFAPGEIAYCMVQKAPLLHFAARWCAKEALKKCDEVFLATSMNQIEVVVDGMGTPFLVHHSSGSTRRLLHAVSLSHTPHAAVAVVVRVELPQVTPPQPTSSTTFNVPPAVPSRRLALMLALLNFIALGMAVVALLRTFWNFR